MRVILREDVKNLGEMGDVITVKNGYARNFLLPKNIVVEANINNIKTFEHEKRKILERMKKIKSNAGTLAEKISQKTFIIKTNAGEEGKLFGSVTAMDIAEALQKEGIEIDKKKITLEDPIKRLGNYTVEVKLHSDVFAKINIEVISE